MNTEVISLTQELVTTESVSGGAGERAVLDLVANWFADRGHGMKRATDTIGSASLVAPARQDDRPLLLFAAHVDTVPVSDPTAWTTNPFAGDIRDGRIFARGASDMKSGLAAAMIAVEAGLRAGAPVALGLTTGEEVGCLGAHSLFALLADKRVGAIVVPESTENRIHLGHRGATWLRLGVDGLAAHGSTPSRGRNAILPMADALKRIAELPLRAHERLGMETVSVGTIHGGTATNIVPDRCVATLDIRTVAAPEAIERWVRTIPGIDDVTVLLSLDPVWTAPDHPVVVAIAGWSGAVIADEPVSYFTDASVLRRHIGAGVPILIWGPGDPTVVHAVDESVSLARIEESGSMFQRVVSAWSRDDMSSVPAIS